MPRPRPPSLKGWDTGEISTPPIKSRGSSHTPCNSGLSTSIL
ncbi:hypothetical protein NC653_021440 [Populus alba x Populus x berolinensis]|uniref:Uncharacterized protein n=1 Tax=Populus alba x Populus x berolinensis TaxID=444605 RepID=A0AAD6QDP4_9ROSI|nr:hypothetical protein NC653_021440 [Populus alba x Populus x berolinensis]